MCVLDDELMDEKMKKEKENENKTNLDRVTEKSEIDSWIGDDYLVVH
jgi:hypothetical protein